MIREPELQKHQRTQKNPCIFRTPTAFVIYRLRQAVLSRTPDDLTAPGSGDVVRTISEFDTNIMDPPTGDNQQK